MPWHVEDGGGDCGGDEPWAVIQDDTEETVGCHASEEAAQEQMAALYAQEGEEPEADAGTDRPWVGVLVLEDTWTGDGRKFVNLSWADPPIPLRWELESSHGGMNSRAVVVGRIDRIEKQGTEVVGAGVIDAAGQHGSELVRLLEAGFVGGVSIDGDMDPNVPVEIEEDDEGRVTFGGARIRAATVVDIPAFTQAKIELVGSVGEGLAAELTPRFHTQRITQAANGGNVKMQADVEAMGDASSLIHQSVVAALNPPSRSWFENPGCTRRESLHVEDNGRVWGHIAGWKECHVSFLPDQCIRPDASASNYAYFLTGCVLTDGGEVRTGPIVLSADHADTRGLSWTQAKDHYANTALAAADVTIGEDAHGIWVAGMVRPGTPDEMVHALRASPPSGDWRRIGGGFELVAILQVNTPGYPPVHALVADGKVEALVASFKPTEHACACGTDDRVAALQRRNVGLVDIVDRYRDAEFDRLTASLADLDQPTLRELAAKLRG